MKQNNFWKVGSVNPVSDRIAAGLRRKLQTSNQWWEVWKKKKFQGKYNLMSEECRSKVTALKPTVAAT